MKLPGTAYELQRFLDSPEAVCVLRLWMEGPSEPPPWTPEAVDDIEDGLRDAYADDDRCEDEADAALEALRSGAPPDAQVLALYQAWYDDWGCIPFWPVYYVYRLVDGDPDKPLYVVTQNHEMGQMSDAVDASGLLESTSAVVDALRESWFVTSDASFEPWEDDGAAIVSRFLEL